MVCKLQIHDMVTIPSYCFSYKSTRTIVLYKYGISIHTENMTMVEINIDNLIGRLLEGKNVFYSIFSSKYINTSNVKFDLGIRNEKYLNEFCTTKRFFFFTNI